MEEADKAARAQKAAETVQQDAAALGLVDVAAGEQNNPPLTLPAAPGTGTDEMTTSEDVVVVEHEDVEESDHDREINAKAAVSSGCVGCLGTSDCGRGGFD